MIRGTVTTDPAAPRTRVIALAPDLTRALATAELDGADFTLDAAADAVVLARLQGPVYAMAHGRARPGEALALDPAAHAPLVPLTVRAEGDVPAELRLTLAPSGVPGFPEGPAATWTYRLDDTTTEPFASWRLADGGALTVQAGTWRVNASHAEGARVQDGRGATRWYLAAARDDRGPLPVDGAGATITIETATTLVLTIARTA